MKNILLVCIIAALGYAGWTYAHRSPPKTAAPPVARPPVARPPVALATPATTPPAAPSATVEPSQHVAPAGTVTKEQLLSAINKDAKVSSLEELLTLPNYRKSTGWSSLYYWTDKLDTGGDSPASFAAEVAEYNGIPLVISIYYPASGSSTFLPWHDKVARAYNDALQAHNDAQLAYNNELAAKNAAQAQLEVYKQAARDINPISTSVRRYVPRHSVASNASYGSYDQPQSTATFATTETRAGNAPKQSFRASSGDGSWHGPSRDSIQAAQRDASEYNNGNPSRNATATSFSQ